MIMAVELAANAFKAPEAMPKLWAVIPWRVSKRVCNSGKFKEDLDLFTDDLQCINSHP
jgi:hypothetical protein